MTDWFTWANLVTALRLALIPATCLAIVNADWLLATVLFTIAVVTDIADGRLARALNQTSPLGGLFDHATDATYVTLATAAIASLGLVNIWLAPLIALAFTQYALDSKALQGQSLRASQIGRLNGIMYFALVGTVIGSQLLGLSFLHLPVQIFGWLLVLSTALSIGDRFYALIRSRA